MSPAFSSQIGLVWGQTYVGVRPRRQVLALDGVVVEADPLGKGLLDVLLVLGVVPVQHVGRVRDARLLAEGLDDLLGVVQQVVGVDDGDGHLAVGVAVGVSVGVTIRVAVGVAVGGAVDTRGHLGALGHGRSHDALRPEVVEHDAELDVAGLVHHEVLEARHVVQGRDGAAVERGDAAPRVADEEGKVVLLHHVQRQHRGVAGLLAGADALGVAVGDALLDPVARGVAIGQAAAERRSNCRRLSFRCH